VAAVDAATGVVAGATFGGWSCASPGPAQFDGTYEIGALAVGHSYTVYAETLNGVVDPSQITNAIDSLRRKVMTDPGWPPLQGCVMPVADISFNRSASARTLKKVVMVQESVFRFQFLVSRLRLRARRLLSAAHPAPKLLRLLRITDGSNAGCEPAAPEEKAGTK
jgi:hypothetical protein